MLPTPPDPTMPRGALRPVTPSTLPALHAPRLLDQVRERVRYLHYSRRTEQAYVRALAGIAINGVFAQARDASDVLDATDRFVAQGGRWRPVPAMAQRIDEMCFA